MKIIIFGAGGHGRVVLDILRKNGEFELAGFLDSNSELHGKEVDGLPVLGDKAVLPELASKSVEGAVIAIGDNRDRAEIAAVVRESGLRLVNAVHPAATVAGNAQVGEGVVLAAGSIICAHARIGDNTIINTGAIIEYECVIKENVNIGPGVKIAGWTTVDSGTFIGIGATLIACLKIGRDSIISAGSIVTKDIPDNVTVVGVHGKIIRESRPS